MCEEEGLPTGASCPSPTPNTHTQVVSGSISFARMQLSMYCKSSGVTQAQGDSSRLGSRWHSRKAEWGHWSCPWSWKKGDPGLRAAYLFFPENDAPHQGRGETQADLRQDLEGSGDQERELALNDEVPESEGEARAPSSQDAFVDEEAMESDQAALDENVECPREEDSVQMQASTGGQTCTYVLVRKRRTFNEAQVSDMEATMWGAEGEESGFSLLFPII